MARALPPSAQPDFILLGIITEHTGTPTGIPVVAASHICVEHNSDSR